MPRHSWFNVTPKNENAPAKVVIEGTIGDWGINSSGFRDAWSKFGKNEDVSVHVCSGGGSITDGNEIANIIGGHEGTVTCSLGSICASIATVIACAADKVIAAKNTVYMVHNPSTYAAGDARDMQKTAEILDKFKDTIVGAYEDKTGMPGQELSDLMDEETWMSAEEAQEMGFVDEIGEDDADDEVINRVDMRHYKNGAALITKMGLNPAANSAKEGVITPLAFASALKHAKNHVQTTATPPPPKQNMTATLIAEQQAANAKAIADGVQAALKARSIRDKGIREVVAAVLKRDKRDWTELAAEFLDNDDTETASLTAFKAAMADSTKFKEAVKERGGSGSGIELNEPLDRFRGTAGFDFVNTPAFKAASESYRTHGRIGQGELKLKERTNSMARFVNTQTSAATSGSGLTSIEKLPGVVELGVRPLTIEDLIAGGATENTTIRYIQEVSYTQAATTVAETGALPAITVTYQEIDATVKDMGAFVKCSEDLLADYLAVASFINQRLPYQVDRLVDDQLLTGDGTGSNITGIANFSGTQTLALANLVATSPNATAGSRADLAQVLQRLVRWQNMTAGQAQGGYEPDGYVVHPTDWESLVLQKDNQGQYLCRGPFTGSYGNGLAGPELVEFYTLWGKKVCISPVTPQGTIWCGAWKMAAQKFDRQGMLIEMTNSDGTDFENRIITIRAARRLALAVYLPGSFASGTGI